MSIIEYRGFMIEFIEHRNAYRIYRPDSEHQTIAYEDTIEEAKAGIDENAWRHMSANDWVMSLNNLSRVKYVVDRLWKQGIRSEDRTIIMLQYGYDEYDADILCSALAEREQIANYRLKEYNPEIGF